MTDPIALAERVVARMYDHDPFSQWLGVERVLVRPGGCVLRMNVRAEMLNGFSIAHGGIAYALADSCLAFSSNAHGIKAVSVETSIAHTRPVKAGDVLTATSTELELGHRFGRYDVRVTGATGKTIALFRGTVFRNGEAWFPDTPTSP
jgi:acyl-CoA thioesterase